MPEEIEKLKLYRQGEVTRKMYNDRLHWYLKADNTLLNGAIVDYYENSRLKLEWHVKNGMYHGTARAWLINGNLRTDENFRNNTSHLIQRYYDEKGNLIRIKEYYDGCRIRQQVLNQNTNKWEERVFCDSYQFNLFE